MAVLKVRTLGSTSFEAKVLMQQTVLETLWKYLQRTWRLQYSSFVGFLEPFVTISKAMFNESKSHDRKAKMPVSDSCRTWYTWRVVTGFIGGHGEETWWPGATQKLWDAVLKLVLNFLDLLSRNKKHNQTANWNGSWCIIITWIQDVIENGFAHSILHRSIELHHLPWLAKRKKGCKSRGLRCSFLTFPQDVVFYRECVPHPSVLSELFNPNLPNYLQFSVKSLRIPCAPTVSRCAATCPSLLWYQRFPNMPARHCMSPSRAPINGLPWKRQGIWLPALHRYGFRMFHARFDANFSACLFLWNS